MDPNRGCDCSSQMRLSQPTRDTGMNFWELQGSFQIPDEAALSGLPEEFHRAKFRMYMPRWWYNCPDAWGPVLQSSVRMLHAMDMKPYERAWGVKYEDFKHSRSAAIILPGMVSDSSIVSSMVAPLSWEGVAMLVIEGGWSDLSHYRQVSDVLSMGRASISAARALLRWLKYDGVARQLGIENVCFGGTDAGGLLAAVAASLTPEEVAVASWQGPTSVADLFTTETFQSACDVAALSRSLSGPWGEADCLSVLDALRRSTALMRAEQKTLSEPGGVASVASRSSFAVEGGLHWLGEGAPVFDKSKVLALREPVKREIEQYPVQLSVTDPLDCVREALGATDLLQFPPPKRPECCEFSVARRAQFNFFEESGERLRWDELMAKWPGASFREVRDEWAKDYYSKEWDKNDEKGGLAGSVVRTLVKLMKSKTG
jgi:hypothetical protein